MPGRRRRHGRDRPGAPPGRHRRGDRARLAARADLLGAVRRVPRGPGRPRAHLHPRRAHRQADRGRRCAGRARTTRTACTPPTGGSSARSACTTTRTPPCAPTTGCWSGTSCASPRSPGCRRPRSTRSSARASSSTRKDRDTEPLSPHGPWLHLMRRAKPALPARPTPPADVLQTARSIAAVQRPDGAIPWPDGHVDPWDHVECAMALSACGLTVPARLGLPVAARHAARRTALGRGRPAARARERRRGGRPRGGEPPRRLRRGRHLARVPGHRRPRVRRRGCGRRSGAAIGWVLGLQAPRGEVAWERDAAGEPRRVRAAVRLLEHPAGAALRDRAGRAGRRAAAGLGARRRPARPRARLPPGGVRGQEPVRDGLVLPGARRRAARRAPPPSGSPAAGTRSWCPASVSAASATSRG